MNSRRPVLIAVPIILLLAGAGLAFAGEEPAGFPGEVLAEFPLPVRHPAGLAWDGELLWLADRDGPSLVALDPASGERRRTLPAPAGCWPVDLAWDGENLWLLARRGPRDQLANLTRIDPEDGSVVAEFPVDRPAAGGVACQGEEMLLGFDALPQAWVPGVIFRFAAAEGPGPNARPFLAPGPFLDGLTRAGERFFGADRYNDRLALFEADGLVLYSFPSPGPHPVGLAFDGEDLWCVDTQTDRLYRLRAFPAAGQTLARRPGREYTLEICHEFHNPGAAPTRGGTQLFIAVPGDRPGQRLLGELTWDPAPADFVQDQWGQRLARWVLEDVPPGERLRFRLVADVALEEVTHYLLPENVGTKADIPAELSERYLADGELLRLDDPAVRQALVQALDGEENLYRGMRRIFTFTADRIEFQLDDRWDDAPTVIKTGRGSCSEYTLVFLALCRAWGLPARYVGGTVRREDDAALDLSFHRWPQVYLPGPGWVDCDPNLASRQAPVDQAAACGRLSAGLFVTTVGGGDSDCLGWDYLSASRPPEGADAPVLVESKWVEWQPRE